MVVLILVIIIAVCLRKRRKAQKGNVTLNKYLPSVTNQEAVALQGPEDNEEEIDLEVLSGEKVCTKEEIKLQP